MGPGKRGTSGFHVTSGRYDTSYISEEDALIFCADIYHHLPLSLIHY